ncbi:MAG: flagellar biosynthesis protein FlhF [Clostridia bacterium]|nr:flagellar biosynthesis protein FlhF [Clostridia bacterium]
MILKRYIVNDIQDGIEKAKKELGSEAVILSTKQIKQRGIKGLFSKPKLEVLVAYDSKQEIAIDSANLPSKKALEPKSKRMYSNTDMSDLENKISNIDNMLNTFLKRFDNNYSDKFASYSKDVRNFASKLLENEVKEEIVYKLADEISGLTKQENLEEAEAIKRVSEKFLGKEKAIVLKRNKPTVVLFLGITGVGKTTTLSKLATMFAVSKNKKVAIITTDTYKIASSEQLKVYSEILDVPLSIIYSTNEIDGEIQKYQDKDIIFIDTGKNPDESAYREGIREIISLANPDDIFMVLSAHTTYKSCVKILDSYNYVKNYKFIITKMDEAMSVGTIFNVRSLSNKPISYLTYGQVLTEDIQEYNPSRIVEELMGVTN